MSNTIENEIAHSLVMNVDFMKHCSIIFNIIINKNESAVQGWERVKNTINRSQPHATNRWKEENDKIVGDKKSRLGPAKSHWLCS